MNNKKILLLSRDPPPAYKLYWVQCKNGASLVQSITLKMLLPTQTIMIIWKRIPKVALLDFQTFSAPESRAVCKAMNVSYLLGPFGDLKFWWKLRHVECYDVLAKLRFVNNRQLWISAKLYIVIWSLLHHNTQPVSIFPSIFHLERLEKVTWFHSFV